MGITPNFSAKDFERMLEEYSAEFERKAFYYLNYLGMECVRVAKSLDTYKDQTGNLRNSIGYAIVKDGSVVESHFTSETIGPEANTSSLSGEVEGENAAKEIATQFRIGFALIIVAGMYYASYVEDVHHLDVIKPAEDYAHSKKDEIVKMVLNSMKRYL